MTDESVATLEKLQMFRDSAELLLNNKISFDEESIENLKKYLKFSNKNILINGLKPSLLIDTVSI